MVKMALANLIEEANCSETTSMHATSAETDAAGLFSCILALKDEIKNP